MKMIGYEPGIDRRNNVTEFLRDLVDVDPGRVLLSWVPREELAAWDGSSTALLRHNSMDAKTLWQMVRRTAAGLEAQGIGKGDRVLVFLPMLPPLYIAMFALQHLGAVPVFLDGWARRDELGASAEIAAPKGVVSFPQAFALMAQTSLLENIPVRVAWGADVSGTVRLESLFVFSSERETEPVEQESTALITFTTGSSGRPKGANRTHRFLAAQHYALRRHLTYLPQDVDLPVFPIFSLNNLASGVRTVLPAINLAEPSPQDPALLLAQFRSEGVSCATLSPWLFRAMGQLCQAQGHRLQNIRRMVTGGAPVSRDEMSVMKSVAPTAEIFVLYGSTEVEPIAHISVDELLAQPSRSQQDPEWEDMGVNVGHIDNGLSAKFVRIGNVPSLLESDMDWEDIEVPNGETGELVVTGEHVCRNYFRDEEAFQRAKIVDAHGRVWHRTGDLGMLDKKGYLWLVGRVHNVIFHASGYLFPVRAEIILRKLAFVKQAAFLGMPNSRGGEDAWCVLERKADVKITEGQQRSEVARVMKINGILFDNIVFVDNIPMDARHHSKVQYAELRTKLLDILPA